jgi:hypothetical protein
MKGDMISLLVVLIFLIIISIIVLIAYNIMGGMITGLTGTGIDTSGMVQAQNAVGVWDAGFIFFVVFMGIISMASALMIRSHPLFFLIAMMLLVIIGVLAPTFSDIYDALASSMPATDAAFPAMGFIMRDASIFFIVIGCLTAIVMYSKTSTEPGL